MEIIKLNIIPSGVNPTCHASQYDEGRVIRVELFEGLTPFTLQANDELGLSIRKPDDKIVTMLVENTEDNYVDIVTTKQACAVVGANLCELTIKRSSVTIGTLNFYMQVERDPLADGDDSESEIRDLQERVNACVEIALEDLYDGTSVLFDAEPVLDHDEPYTVTSNGIAQAFGAVNTALGGKVDNSTLTANYYNKTQVDGALNGKVDNSALDYYYTKNDTYSKTEVNNLFSGLDIDDLHDVAIDAATLAGGQGLVYDAVTGEWKNGEVSTTSTLEELTDTNIQNKQDGDGLLFDSTSNKWINQAITKELSQAAYDNLSQAEKENGTAYYVPDAPAAAITANDIEWSTGVTLENLIKYLIMTEQGDLNSTLNLGTSSPRLTYYASTATNKPSGNSGIAFTMGNQTYRQQIAFDLEGNIFARYYNNGTISNWVNNVATLNARLVNARLTFNGTYFTIPSAKPRPYNNQQITVLGRNLSNGAVYAMWYDYSVDAFRLSATLVGNAPSTNNTVDVQYLA